ncbi:MAG: 4-alpha-glucanotransferase [Nocardioidaceae bacterium]|nr:4-alpha-glucanotransferase [Nocardioidaceae bacterium]
MTADIDERMGPDAWGIQRHWVDANDKPQTVEDDTILLLRELIGEPPSASDRTAPIVTRPGRDLGLGDMVIRVVCEDGQTRAFAGAVPDDFPLGYHQMHTDDGHTRTLIVSPGRCWLPEGWRAWGWTVQVYAARSRHSWGMGDLGDLKALREWSESIGAGFMLINPLHAVAPTAGQEASPYLPVTRQYRNPLYLRIDDVPGADRMDLADLAEAGRSLSQRDLIDRDAVFRLKSTALRLIFDEHRFEAEASGGSQLDASESSPDAFAAWRREQGQPLHDFATWCVLTQLHGADWRCWPVDLHDPRGAAVSHLADTHADEVEFYAWVQWLLERQLREATGRLTVIQDLPIGVDGGGSDAWAWQDQIAAGASVGAPPDAFNSLGQDWGSPPLHPWRLRAQGYDAFISSIRATMANAGGLRIDHVMGLFRLWWVPEGKSPAEGAYVRYPSGDLLDIVALESHRAQAIVVGEDLGTVEHGVRETLAEHNVLSYRLLWFEEPEPAEWPVSAMAAVTTHDLPTVAGLWLGTDVEEQRARLAEPEDQLQRGRQQLLSHLDTAELAPDASGEQAVVGAHRLLARAPSILLAATLEDAVATQQRPNMPGAMDRPNWCIPLPVRVEDLATYPLAQELIEILRPAVTEPMPIAD